MYFIFTFHKIFWDNLPQNILAYTTFKPLIFHDIVHSIAGTWGMLTYFIHIHVTNCLCISLGPWAKKFLIPLGLDLPLRTLRNESLFWEADPLPDNGRRNFNLIIVSDGEDTDGCYIIPEHEYPGLVKVCVCVRACVRACVCGACMYLCAHGCMAYLDIGPCNYIMNHNSRDEEGYGGKPQSKISHIFSRWRWGTIG